MNWGGGAYMQTVASATKLPLLFFLTLGITLPSLYVFNSLMGSRLSMGSVLRLLRPFIGNPDTPTHFFRQGAWGNAYVKLGEILWRLIGG